ncbi:MFS transporter [Agrilactobacillus yilanensis]|uniref:MFS transporter n=1 Tax=Agrilactobacillus yilanensis TaxID=2485997 RepID=A0ABW4J4F9_9LACO|nr:MFS transporter [Agrilactobacillus yilanensis]
MKDGAEITASKTRLQGQDIKIIVALMAGYSMVYMDKNMVSTAIIPIAKQFDFTTSQTGLIMSMFFLAYTLMQIPGGWLADKIGAKKVLLLSLGIISIFSYAFGMVSSLMLFLAIRFGAGIGHGGYPSSCSKAVAENFDKNKRVMVQSGILTTSGIGGILAFTLGANIIALKWRYGYFLLGTLFLIAFLLVLFLLPSTPQVASTAKAKSTVKFREIITNRNVLILFVIMILLNITYYGSMSWLPSYLTKTYQLSLGAAGAILAVNSISQVFGSFMTGMILSKWFVGKQKQFILICAVISASAIIALVNIHSVAISVVLVAIIGMVTISAFTATFTWPQHIFEQEVIGSSVGIINTGGTFGGFLAPMIIGALVQASGGNFKSGFILLAVSILLGGLGTFLVKINK